MVIQPGYKQTEVGVIPKTWDVYAIGRSMRLINGRAFKPRDWKQRGIPIIRIQNLNDPDSAFNYCDTPIEGRHRIEVGDVLFAWSGTTGTSFGARIWEGPTGVLNQHIFKVIADEKILTSFFSFLILQKVQEDIEKQAHGFKASFVHVKKSDLVKVSLPVPPLCEQRAIAKTLRDTDALIAALDQLIAKKRDLKQAAMQQLLTGQKRLLGFHGEWQIKAFSEVCWYQEGPGVRNTQFTTSGIKLLNGTNIFCGILNLENTNRFISEKEARGAYAHFLAEEGDIVIASSGITIERLQEKVALVKSEHLPFCMNTSTIRFKPFADVLTSAFLYQYLTSNIFKRMIGGQATGSAQLNFGPSHVAKIAISMPPLAEQTAIAEVLSDMDEELVGLEQRRDKTRALKQGMMQELLTGKTRMV